MSIYRLAMHAVICGVSCQFQPDDTITGMQVPPRSSIKFSFADRDCFCGEMRAGFHPEGSNHAESRTTRDLFLRQEGLGNNSLLPSSQRRRREVHAGDAGGVLRHPNIKLLQAYLLSDSLRDHASFLPNMLFSPS